MFLSLRSDRTGSTSLLTAWPRSSHTGGALLLEFSVQTHTHFSRLQASDKGVLFRPPPGRPGRHPNLSLSSLAPPSRPGAAGDGHPPPRLTCFAGWEEAAAAARKAPAARRATDGRTVRTTSRLLRPPPSPAERKTPARLGRRSERERLDFGTPPGPLRPPPFPSRRRRRDGQASKAAGVLLRGRAAGALGKKRGVVGAF